MRRKTCNAKRSGRMSESRDFHLFNAQAQAFGNQHCTLGIGLRQNDDKLISTKAGRRIDRAQFRTQVIRQHAKCLVASFMSSLIVDVFEVIEVEHDQRKWLAHARREMKVALKL